MRNYLLGLMLVVTPVTAASAQDVARFMVRVDRLLARGPLALLSRDFYRLKREIEADGETLRREYAREKAAGQSTAFCPPAKGKPRVGKHEYLAALRAVPMAKRMTTDTKDVLRGLLERKYPCARLGQALIEHPEPGDQHEEQQRRKDREQGQQDRSPQRARA